MELRPNKGARKTRKRKGIGIAAGQGKTAGRGTKGEKARGRVKPGFAGGQFRVHRRLPKLRGSSNRARNIGMFRREWATVNLFRLAQLDVEQVTPSLLLERGVIKGAKAGVKVLGVGELSKAVRVEAHAFSRAAREKIEAAGGEAVIV